MSRASTWTYRGTEFTELDVDAVMARAPQVALVDELAHTNAPGSKNEKRWQDIDELLDAGIDVLSTVQRAAPRVAQRRGRADHRGAAAGDRARRGACAGAEQIELVDITPQALRRRMAHGNVYPPERVDAALCQLLPDRAT